LPYLLLEGRTVFEWASSFFVYPMIPKRADGDGRPVLIFPPLLGNDLVMKYLRKCCQQSTLQNKKQNVSLISVSNFDLKLGHKRSHWERSTWSYRTNAFKIYRNNTNGYAFQVKIIFTGVLLDIIVIRYLNLSFVILDQYVESENHLLLLIYQEARKVLK